MKYTSLPGVFDIIPNDDKEIWRTSYLWQYVENVMRETAKDFGYFEIRTPIIEKIDLFQRSAGEASDIVSKEMYVFEDRGQRQVALRPEGTAPVMRAFIENQIANQGNIHKLFYVEPMFRYDRPQAGRYRQHHQFGAEAIGVNSAEQDVEMIDMLYTTLRRLKLKNLTISLNTLGDENCRKSYREALKGYLKPHLAKLSSDSQRRIETNPLRILDSKDPQDQALLAEAPSILDFLAPEDYYQFQSVKEHLTKLKIPFEVNPKLVRGLDYYNGIVFEVISSDLGAQNSLGGGGRFDGLLKSMDGPDLPSMGFGAGIERIIQTMIKQGVELPAKPRLTTYLIPLGENGKKWAFKLVHELRDAKVPAAMELADSKLNKAMQYANDIGTKYVLVIGDNEVATKMAELKEMATGTVRKVNLESVVDELVSETKPQQELSLPEFNIPPEAEADMMLYIQNIQKTLGETRSATEEFNRTLRDIKRHLEE